MRRDTLNLTLHLSTPIASYRHLEDNARLIVILYERFHSNSLDIDEIGFCLDRLDSNISLLMFDVELLIFSELFMIVYMLSMKADLAICLPNLPKINIRK